MSIKLDSLAFYTFAEYSERIGNGGGRPLIGAVFYARPYMCSKPHSLESETHVFHKIINGINVVMIFFLLLFLYDFFRISFIRYNEI